MEVVLRKTTYAPMTPYYGLKHRLLGLGVLSCYQVGYNIAMGELAAMETLVQQWLMGLDDQCKRWHIPVLIRRDWVPDNCWHAPPESQWCTEQPGGHLLTPRLSMHLLNNMGKHGTRQGSWVLDGTCVRDETDTLPLYKQRNFTSVEFVWAGEHDEVVARLSAALRRIWSKVKSWDLPVEWLVSTPDTAEHAVDLSPASDHDVPKQFPQHLSFQFPDAAPIKLCVAELIPASVREAYGIPVSIAALSCGVERWCLALLARHGLDGAGLHFT